MISLRRLNRAGIAQFLSWLESNESGTLPKELWKGSQTSEPAYDLEIDETKSFPSRYAFGDYLGEMLHGIELQELLGAENDGMWAWLAAVYFSQLSPGKHRKSEHYIVTRQGPVGSLAYRQGPRTSFDLVRVHKTNASLCLNGGMSKWGEMAEQLCSRQTVVYNRAFFDVAGSLYLKDGKLLRGSGAKPKKVSERRPGEKAGFGGARRLALALQRLDLTYDTFEMVGAALLPLLPREFAARVSVLQPPQP